MSGHAYHATIHVFTNTSQKKRFLAQKIKRKPLDVYNLYLLQFVNWKTQHEISWGRPWLFSIPFAKIANATGNPLSNFCDLRMNLQILLIAATANAPKNDWRNGPDYPLTINWGWITIPVKLCSAKVHRLLPGKKDPWPVVNLGWCEKCSHAALARWSLLFDHERLIFVMRIRTSGHIPS